MKVLRVLELDPHPTLGDVIDALSDLAKTHGRDWRFCIDGFGCNSEIEDVRTILNNGELTHYMVARKQ